MKHNNPRKLSKINSFPQESIENVANSINGLLSFNFKFFDKNQGQKFSDLTYEQLEKFLEKLKNYSEKTRNDWEVARIGSSDNRVLAIYTEFPKKSDFFYPMHVPAGIKWARFRLEGDARLIGFMMDKEDVVKFGLNENVFYVVFLDMYHKFFKI